jgi:hypothetical protein
MVRQPAGLEPLTQKNTMRTRVLVMSAVAIAASVGAAHAAPVAGQGTWETTLQGRDFNSDGVADAFYDTSLDLTWMRQSLGPMTWDGAANQLAGFAPFGGLTNWRLPITQRTFDFNPDPASGEMTHLWYITLGNTALFDPSGGGPMAGGGLSNTGDFLDLQPNIYWTGTQQSFNPNSGVYLFRADYGYNTMFGSNPQDPGSDFAIYVHAGDVGVALVPEPQTLALVMAALCGLLAAGGGVVKVAGRA